MQEPLLTVPVPTAAAALSPAPAIIFTSNGKPSSFAISSLIVPTTFIDFISSPEDTNLRPQFANFLKFC